MKTIAAAVACALAVPFLAAQTVRVPWQRPVSEASDAVPQGVVSDWTHRHVLYPAAKDEAVVQRLQRDPRWQQNWYLRHREVWWPEQGYHHRRTHRDWSVPLGAASFGPVFDFTFDIPPQIGYGSLYVADEGNGDFLATTGSVTITAGSDIGTYPLYPGGPAVTTSPMGAFDYDDLIYWGQNPPLDVDGLLFNAPGLEINIWGNSANNYSYYDYSNGAYGTELTGTGSFAPVADPGGSGQAYPAKFVFNVNEAPSCSNDYVVIGLPATPASGGQANIVGVNNLYSGSIGALCSTGPTVMFAYASGTGQVPASVVLSQNGSQLAYIENLPTGSSYFHALTLGTTGTNGSSASAAVIPGSTGGNNAVDQTVLLSPDGGVTNQSSTNSPWVAYTPGDLNDVAYVTTYSSATSSGYLYKIANVFNGGAPTILWSLAIDAMPSSPVYDFVSNTIFFTDSNGRIDSVLDSSPSVVYGSVLASGATSENPVIVDSTNQMVYATFNSNGTNALVVQTPTNMSSTVSVAVGAAGTIYGSPYEPDFNNAWYTGSGTPLLYIAGTGTGSLPTLYSVGFDAFGVLNSTANATTAALTSATADSSPVTEFYNATLGIDFLFVGVDNNCIATTEGGMGGCVMSLDITSGFPTVNAGTTALAAAGGTSGIIVDNDSSATEASSIYYATKTGGTLVKATQSGLN
jgi:hypothetical protein